jgi:hypothetical protein
MKLSQYSINHLMRLSFAIVFLSFFLSSCGQKVHQTFLIPIGFQGRINIIFNQPNAAPIPIVNGRRIYHIPEDGVLITSSKLETGFIDQEYYYIDKDGKRTKIPVQDLNAKDVPDKPAVVYYGVTGVYGNSSDPNPLNFEESIIASKATSDSIYSHVARTALDEIIRKKVGR